MAIKNRTLLVLGIAQCFGQTAAPILVLLGGIIGAAIAPSAKLAALPVAVMIVGTASTTVLASMLMAKIGRKAGFMIATCNAIIAGLIAAYALLESNFSLFCVAAFLIGGYAAFLQQFRFAVAESVPMELVPKSLSLLMLAGIVAAFLGPEVASQFSVVEGWPDFVGSFLGLSAMMCISLFVLLFYQNTVLDAGQENEVARPLLEILKNPMLILAITAAVVGWSIMSLIMTATPVSMHHVDQLSLADTKWVIQSHIIAMYLPSLFSGFLFTKFGAERIIQVGLVLMLGCAAAGYGEPQLTHYWLALVLLGIGWNFLFVGGTTLLTRSYRLSERFKVQAFNDFSVFGVQVFAALGSGVLLSALGWNGVILFSLPWLVVLVPILIYARPRLVT